MPSTRSGLAQFSAENHGRKKGSLNGRLNGYTRAGQHQQVFDLRKRGRSVSFPRKTDADRRRDGMARWRTLGRQAVAEGAAYDRR